jgi:hypothetical protein
MFYITIEEIQNKYKNKMKNNKATGEDEVAIGGIKLGGDNYGGQKILAVKKKMCKPYFIVTMITVVLIMIGIFWVVNFKTRNYFVIFYYTDVYLRLSMYDCSILFIHVGFLEYLSLKQFKLIVRITICMSK